jgi:choloylglycine hydrolase
MCTNFKMKTATDGTAVIGRSMEFPVAIPFSVGVLPVGYVGKGAAPQGKSVSQTWTSTYGLVGMAAFGNPQWLSDGMNSAGVSIHALYMPNGCCVYSQYKGDGTDLSEVDVIAYLLGTCGSVAEVKAAAAGMNVWGLDPGMGFAPPLHFLVHDASSSIAIEFHETGLQVIDNPTGVGTNAPYMDWHLTNLNNYVGIQDTDRGAVQAFGETFQTFDTGNGLMGLPGDYSGPSRFVRAAALVSLSDIPADSKAAEMQTLHILNAFDIPPGAIRMPGVSGKLVDEVTVWITISNLTEKRYSYRTMGDPTIYVVELADIDFTKPARSVDMSWSADFTPVTV